MVPEIQINCKVSLKKIQLPQHAELLKIPPKKWSKRLKQSNNIVQIKPVDVKKKCMKKHMTTLYWVPIK